MPEALAALRTAATIRQRCANITRAVDEGRSTHFSLARDKLEGVVDRVEALTRARYPALDIPYHSRWRHFEAGGVDRKAQLDAALAGRTSAAQARARIDLTVLSVLLDAGAGTRWRYVEAPGGASHPRSEGLAVASFHAFMGGQFSSDPGDPYRVDAAALKRLDAARLAELFQASDANPLVGLQGRAALLRRLGETLQSQPLVFGGEGRPGGLFDALTHHGRNHRVAAGRVLHALLDHFSAIWPSDNRLRGEPLGDCWRHPLAGGEGESQGWVPFHKLSQWLVYSLVEPFEWAGISITELDALTGLPEYRNGGLFLDAGVIVPREASYAERRYRAGDPFVVEWRALTLGLLDEVATRLRSRLGRLDLPLACVLEGGTWAAGREIARELRADASSPLQIDSDATVF
ncbi:MAG: URC4/urg3 family protein [Burkholderiaceae bacterium]